MKTKTLETAKRLVAAQTTETLCATFAVSEIMEMTREVSVTRCWIMAELERRNKTAYDAWMIGPDDELPGKYFL